MKTIQAIEFQGLTREERLPGFFPDFPYIATRAELDRYPGRFAPWHWHRTVELFYVESGTLEYDTPGGRHLFPPGSGGLVNSNVLHMTRAVSPTERITQILHIFDPTLLSGDRESRIARNYIAPIVTAPQIELIPLSPQDREQAEILRRILSAFRLSPDSFGYEIRLREALSEIWLRLFPLCAPHLRETAPDLRGSEKIKEMMAFIHGHYPEPVTVAEIASSAFLSQRECFRVFRACLHTTPMEYLRSCRLQAACRMLGRGQESVTAVGSACGLGSSSYFGRIFREHLGCTPSEYRKKWQNRDN